MLGGPNVHNEPKRTQKGKMDKNGKISRRERKKEMIG
jgi:hypothetical protein